MKTLVSNPLNRLNSRLNRNDAVGRRSGDAPSPLRRTRSKASLRFRFKLLTLGLLAVVFGLPAFAQGTAFTYQGRLNSGSAPATGTYNLTFSLFNINSGSVPIAGPVTNNAVGVTNGLFTALIDFGSGVFTGQSNWLEIAVSTNGANPFTTLTPRQPLTPTPYAIYAETAGSLPALLVQPNTNGAPNLIGGSPVNYASSGVVGATIGGGGAVNYAGVAYTNSVTADFGTVNGGRGNQASGQYATISGGRGNLASGFVATIAGGDGNSATLDDTTVSGGWGNSAWGLDAAVGGGDQNGATGHGTVVAGGEQNNAGGDFSTVSGGQNNNAAGAGDTLAGGFKNSSGGGNNSTISGGNNNNSSGSDAVIGGGQANQVSAFFTTIGGGVNNVATNDTAVVSGGTNNVSGGYAATVPGGSDNQALGNYSFAAGHFAQTTNSNSFVWSDGSTNTVSTTTNQFVARAANGFVFYSSTGGTGVSLAPGSGSWSTMSDRNAKDGFAPVNPETVLARVASLPMTTWSYKTEPGVRHVGPMAQDFHAAFRVGENDTTISTVDEGGVALAAIQGLNQKLADEAKARDAEIQQLKQNVAQLQAMVAQLAKVQSH